MPRGIANWTFNNVIRFLKENKFRHSHTSGSHYFYIGYTNNTIRQVTVPFHGNRSIKPRTMKSIILQSGISQDKWIGDKSD